MSTRILLSQWWIEML